MLIAPLFVRPGSGVREPISSLAGQARLSPDQAVVEAQRLAELGVGGIILFGLPDAKDDEGSGAWIADGIVQQTLRRLRDRDLPLVLIADTCLCEYTAHGHCGPLLIDGSVDNDSTIAALARTAVSQAAAGADIVAQKLDPSTPSVRQYQAAVMAACGATVVSIERIEPKLLRLLMDNGYLPVVTPPAISHDGVAINVDGDRLAMEIATALKAERLLIFADTPGFMRDVADEHSVIPVIRLDEVDAFAHFGKGRARVKLLSAAQAIRRGIQAVGLLDGRGDHPLTRAFEGAGTWITR